MSRSHRQMLLAAYQRPRIDVSLHACRTNWWSLRSDAHASHAAVHLPVVFTAIWACMASCVHAREHSDGLHKE